MYKFYLIISVVFSLSTVLTFWVRKQALRRSVLDIPNARSSHSTPTPRGGGLAIAISFFLGIILLVWQGIMPHPLAFALLSGGSMVAFIGYLDDRYSLGIRWRLCIHFLAAAIALYYLNLDSLQWVKNGNLPWNVGSYLLALFSIVWAINLYNFMDGIDGLASSEAIFVSLAISVLSPASSINSLCWVLTAAVAGFLIWNWPPAKIFMGDVSSGLLGFIFAVLAFDTAGHEQLPLITWFILLAVFIIDASFTLMRRFLAGEPWYTAHRSHAYQRLVQQDMSHGQTTASIILFNSLFLLPLAYLSLQQFTWSIITSVLVLAVVGLIWYRIIVKYPHI